MKSHLRGRLFLALLVSTISIIFVACATPTPTPTPSSPSAPGPSPTPAHPPSPSLSPTVPASTPETPPGYVEPTAVDSSEATFTSEEFSIKAYLSKPKSVGSFPGLIIIHENRGLNKHIEDVTRRFANQGYVALAPDLLSRVGGTAQFATTDDAVAAIRTLSADGIAQDLKAAFTYLQSLPYVKIDSIGVIGYCWGGGNSLLFATRNPELKAAVVYYGPNPANIDDVAKITAPVLGIYGAEDTRITVNVPGLEEAMKTHNKAFEYNIYPEAAHAFFNDTSTRHNREAAIDAWQRTVSFLQEHLMS